MLSDGCVTKNKMGLKLKYTDEYIITEMFNKFSSGYKTTTDKNGRSISLSSTKMICALAKLGCVENKTEIGFNLPEITNDLFRHFVRGYFDGDGTVSINTTRPNQIGISICSVDNNFLLQLQEKLSEFNILTSIYRENRKDKKDKLPIRPDGEYCTDNKDMFRLTIQTHKERLKFYEFLYDNCTIKLKRKYEKYKQYYSDTMLNLNTDEVNEQLVLKMFKEGKCEYAIHKETKIGRSVIKRILSNL
jgi:intein/homing endonuclease